MKFITLAVLLIGLAVGQARAQNESLLLNEDFISDARQAIDSVYNLNYEASLEILTPWQETHPEHPVWIFWQALELWWRILPDLENTVHDEAFFDILEQARNTSAERLRGNRDIDALIIKSMSYGFTARHLSNRGSWYQSLRNARAAMNHFQELERLVPDLADIQFGLGMQRYFMAYFTRHYPVIRPFAWMLPRGDREDGLERLAIAADNSTFMIPEATFFLGHIYLHYERNFNQANGYLRQLTERYPDNGYYHRLLARSYYRSGNRSTAFLYSRQTLSKWEDKYEVEDQALKEELYVLQGRVLMLRGELEDALEAFKVAYQTGITLEPYGNRRNFLTASYYLGELNLTLGNRIQAQVFLEKAAASYLDYDYVGRAKTLLRQEF